MSTRTTFKYQCPECDYQGHQTRKHMKRVHISEYEDFPVLKRVEEASGSRTSETATSEHQGSQRASSEAIQKGRDE